MSVESCAFFPKTAGAASEFELAVRLRAACVRRVWERCGELLCVDVGAAVLCTIGLSRGSIHERCVVRWRVACVCCKQVRECYCDDCARVSAGMLHRTLLAWVSGRRANKGRWLLCLLVLSLGSQAVLGFSKSTRR